MFRRKYLSQVRHITLNPGGPGVVRLHMLPPATHLRRSVPYVVILNGHDVLPLNISWAILLACLMDALAPYADREVPDEDLEGLAEKAVAAARRVRCGSVFHVIWNQEREAAGLDQKMSEDTSSSVRVSVEALKILIEEDRKAGR